jgi:radical SAM superfamily enzyme YgiQ (UPF0313 family)
MKVLLINPLIQKAQWENDITSKWPPLGIAYIAAVLEKNGHQVKILERRLLAGVKPRTKEHLKKVDNLTIKQIKEFEPEIVGITASTPLIMDAYWTAKLVKGIDSSIIVVIGGAHPTAEPIFCLEQCSEIDIVCRGEGELTMLDLANKLPLDKIDGITFRKNGQIVSTSNRQVWENLDEIPYPAYHLLDKNFYFKPTSVLIRGFYLKGMTIIAARGCPFNCAFCQSSQLARSNKGRFLRFHSSEYVIGMIKHLIDNYGVEGILFAEDIFSLDKENMVKICNLLIKERLDKKIKYAVNLRVDTVDEELLRLLKNSGCVRAIYGFESGSDRVLKIMNKRTTLEQNLRAVKLTKEAGITCEASILIGAPGEQEEDLKKTLKFLKRSKPNRVIRSKFFPIPGTTFYNQLLEKSIIEKPENWDILMEKYTLSDYTFADMSKKRFKKLWAKLDREGTLPINYMFAIKMNWKKRPIMALRQFLLMIVHCATLYLPSTIQNPLRKLAEKFRIKSKYVFE